MRAIRARHYIPAEHVAADALIPDVWALALLWDYFALARDFGATAVTQ
jgi:hypothetical protein